MKTTEDVRKEAVLEKVEMPKLLINGKEEDPILIISLDKKQIKIFMNQNKVYRTVNLKNKIENTLDIFLIDTIKELLQTLADREEAVEKIKLQEVKNESTIRKSGRTTGNDRTPGSRGTKTSERFV